MPKSTHNKQQLDTLIVDRGQVDSREHAKRLIRDGEVLVDGQPHLKPGQPVSTDAKIEIKQPLRYVGRGGLKLEKALHSFDVDVRDKVAIDVGASTGGFTGCLLQHGAKFVYAVDVGHGQLVRRLRLDPRVCPIERTNIRTINPNLFDQPIQIGVIDVSFISLQKVLPIVLQRVEPPSELIALVKPQFEAGRKAVGKGGVVRNPQIHINVIEELTQFVHGIDGCVMGITHSPIQEPGGNIEYLLWLRQDTAVFQPAWKDRIAQVVQHAHEELNRGASYPRIGGRRTDSWAKDG